MYAHFNNTLGFLSTPSARRATLQPPADDPQQQISIHALREEGDIRAARLALYELLFLSTPSARRATDKIILDTLTIAKFLSTPSARRATDSAGIRAGGVCYFYPRPPRGGRLVAFCTVVVVRGFLSTPSARRATRRLWRRM